MLRSKPRNPQTTNKKPNTTNHTPHTTHHKPQITNHKPQTTNHKPQTTNHKPQTTNHKPQTANHKSGNRKQAESHKKHGTPKLQLRNKHETKTNLENKTQQVQEDEVSSETDSPSRRLSAGSEKEQVCFPQVIFLPGNLDSSLKVADSSGGGWGGASKPPPARLGGLAKNTKNTKNTKRKILGLLHAVAVKQLLQRERRICQTLAKVICVPGHPDFSPKVVDSWQRHVRFVFQGCRGASRKLSGCYAGSC